MSDDIIFLTKFKIIKNTKELDVLFDSINDDMLYPTFTKLKNKCKTAKNIIKSMICPKLPKKYSPVKSCLLLCFFRPNIFSLSMINFLFL